MFNKLKYNVSGLNRFQNSSRMKAAKMHTIPMMPRIRVNMVIAPYSFLPALPGLCLQSAFLSHGLFFAAAGRA